MKEMIQLIEQIQDLEPAEALLFYKAHYSEIRKIKRFIRELRALAIAKFWDDHRN